MSVDINNIKILLRICGGDSEKKIHQLMDTKGKRQSFCLFPLYFVVEDFILQLLWIA